ncbi:MAG: carboxylesterase family protein, partial [Trebonia sp.]
MAFVNASLAHGGQARGVSFGGCARFLGVPYGTADRFRPPVPCADWSGDALEFGPSAPQVPPFCAGDLPPISESLLGLLYPRGGSPVEGGAVSEDCLRVNVWTPSVAGARPVMVWLHGGAFLHGSGNEMAFNGDVLASAEDVVVVTVTHRIGLLGFLELDGFDGSGNAGMLDIVLALRWVRDNIAGFGGNPSNVTVFGQSGGGMKGASLLAMPAATGLFHKLIMQSGPALRVSSPEAAASFALRVMAACGVSSASGLREIPVEQLLSVQADLGNGMTPDITKAMTVGPVRHHVHLPCDLFADGAPTYGSDVPLLIGSATHDMAMMLCGIPAYPDATFDTVAGFLGADVVSTYRSLYPVESAP